MSVEPIVTVADLETMPDDNNRYEVIDGELFVSKSPAVPHQRALRNLIPLFLNHKDAGEVLPNPGLIFSDLDAVIPDLVFIKRERIKEVISGDRVIAAPDLVVEILSPGPDNRRRDRIAKRQLYAKFGVQEYWIVDLENKSLEIYILRDSRLESTGVLGLSDTIRSTILVGFNQPVAAIFSE